MGKERQVKTAEEFLALLAKSRLFSAKQVESLQERCEGLDPKAIAKQLVQKERLTAWQAVQLLGGMHALRLGKYTLVDHLGRSELGQVFLARHGQQKKSVALQSLASRHLTDKGRVDQFLEEARQAAELDHANVLRVRDVDHEGARYFIALDHVEGTTLQAKLDAEGPLPIKTATEYVRQAAQGLAHAHEKGVLHRQLNPTNLLITEAGVLKILDLGIAGLTLDAESNGAMDYRAPEQLQSQETDVRTDVYALGCTFYALLSGQPPFHEGANDARRKQ